MVRAHHHISWSRSLVFTFIVVIHMSLPIIDSSKIVSHLKCFMSPLCINVFSVIDHFMNTSNLNYHVSKQCEFLEIGEICCYLNWWRSIYMVMFCTIQQVVTSLTCTVNVMDQGWFKMLLHFVINFNILYFIRFF